MRTGARILLAATAVVSLWRTDGQAADARAAMVGGTRVQRQVMAWAMARYGEAGLTLPPVHVVFHDDAEGCGGNSGFFATGRLDVCVTEACDYARNVMVHELAHAWSDANLTAADRTRFLELRRLTSWNSWDEPWAYRGYEQAAEIVTWGVGDRSIPPLLEDDDDPEQLAVAYEALTGLPAPAIDGRG